QLRGDNARDDVGRPAGRIGHENPHRLGGIRLGLDKACPAEESRAKRERREVERPFHHENSLKGGQPTTASLWIGSVRQGAIVCFPLVPATRLRTKLRRVAGMSGERGCFASRLQRTLL